MSYQGSCHCGTVKYQVNSTAVKLTQCNCSICTKKGALHLRVLANEFQLTQGQDAIEEYRFGTGTARHFFCPICGIHTHANPRIAPDQVSVNARTLDEFDSTQWDIVQFEGKNWEAAAAKLRGVEPATPLTDK